jgi:hypothetical protein
VTPEGIETTWKLIEAEGRLERGWHVRKLEGAGQHDLQVGRRMPSGSVGLLYEVSSAMIAVDAAWPDAKGFRTDVEMLKGGANGRIRIALELTNSQYRDVFAALCGDVAAIVMEEADERRGVSAFIRRLHAWQKFMQLHSPGGLSSEQLRGLFSELKVLELFLLPAVSPPAAIEMWQGRQGLHDFARDGQALEVKSSVATTDPVVMVSRLDQLDETLVARLHLCFVPLVEDGNGESVPELVARLREILRPYPAGLQRLDDLLVAYGYHDTQAPLYVDTRLLCGEFRFFEVRDAFPRLRMSELREGVISGRYSIRLSSCEDCRVEMETCAGAFVGGPDGDDRG